MKFKSDTAGRFAIYTDGNDNPLSNPTSNFSRLKFHSDLDYVRIISSRTGVISLPARGVNQRVLTTHNGPTHGQSGSPFVMGYLRVGGQDIAFAGSVPVQVVADGASRFLALGANTTRLLFHEQSNCSAFDTLPATSIFYVVYITDLILT